ncbi:MAG: chromate resistance protein, partial [Rubrivivax sp.]
MNWLLLILSLPTENGTARMRAWRALKASGAAVLRDGVHVLPDDSRHADTLAAIADDLRANGGTAHLLRTDDAAPDYRALFDRGDDYAAVLDDIGSQRASLRDETAAETVRQCRKLRRTLEQLTAIDFFP